MADLFRTVLTMSLTATVAAAVVMLLRLLLKRLNAPRPVIFLLWAVVLFRMVCPFSFESPASALGLVPASVGGDVLIAPPSPPSLPSPLTPSVEGAVAGAPPVIEGVPPVPVLPLIWAFGVLVLCLYALISYLRLKRRVSTAVWAEGGLWESDRIDGPFVLGFFPPKIYLPLGLPEATRDYVVLHERTHIRRLDHLVKALSFLALALHWFNPVLWLAWVLACRDMEAACDESLLKDYPLDGRKRYSSALLTLAAVKPMGVPLAFGENDVKNRIRNVLKEKRPAEWLIACCVLLTLLTGYALTANPIPLPQEAPTLLWERGELALAAAVDAPTWEDAPTIVPAPSGEIHLFFHGYPDEVSARLYSQEGAGPMDWAVEHESGFPFTSLTLPRGWVSQNPNSALVLTARWTSGVNSEEHTYTLRLGEEARGLDFYAPTVLADNREITLLREENPYTLSDTSPTAVTSKDIITIRHPTGLLEHAGNTVAFVRPNHEPVGYWAQLFYPKGNVWVPLNQGFGATAVDTSPLPAESAFRLSTRDSGLFLLKITYTYPSGTQVVWQGQLEIK